MEVFTALLLLIIGFALWMYKKCFNFWSDLGVPQFETSFPSGNAKGIAKDRHISDFLVEYYEKTKAINARFSGIYLYIRPIMMIADLDLIKTILVKDFNVFPNRGFYHNEKDDPISAHLFNLEDDPWRLLRQKLTPTFTSGKLKMMFGTISEVADKLLLVIDKQIENTGQLEVKDTLARFTTDVIGTTAFGIDCNSLEEKDSKFYEMGMRIFTPTSSFFSRIMRSNFKKLSQKFHFKLLSEDLANFYMGITKQTIDYREKNPQLNRQDFMNILVELKKEKVVTIEQIAAQSFIFFLAGFETSSSTMTYCMYELSINEEIQEKARQSVLEAIKKHGNELTYDAVADMDYLEQCVDETLRKYPVVSQLQRTSTRDYKIPGSDVIFPKGSALWIPVHAIHHDASIYPEPDKFIPDRFTQEEKAKRHPYAYLPFGEGPRICIGMRFGIVETKLGLAKLLLNYKFTLDRTKTSVPLKISPEAFVLTPSERIFLDIKKIAK
ncbi:CLUMA_CG018145, isoform A [Clunio marinus]|uniref:CLUMA_CG018145, isoform A n=1 Tax=Clunio marinus TaxID=568069 RepID=A0A1J1IY70_9DIPT|nr:CLUMA_CG018145, isoform A [Clunio marinus]